MGLMAESKLWQVNGSALGQLFSALSAFCFCKRHRKVQKVQTVNNFESVFLMPVIA
jgi:hypothetical protein